MQDYTDPWTETGTEWVITTSTPKTLGLDFSKYQGDIDLNKAVSAGCEFFFCRVGGGYLDNGTPFVDDLWLVNKNKLMHAGKPWAGYWYFIPRNVEAQAEELIEQIQFTDYWMPVAIDCEKWWTSAPGLTKEQATDALNLFLKLLDAAGIEHLIYTRASFWNDHYLSRESLTVNDLWVAHWDTEIPALPEGWNAYVFHQFSGEGNGRGAEFGSGPGVGGDSDIDLDYFYGDLAALHEYIGYGEEYPYLVKVKQELNTQVRAAPGAGKFMDIAKYGYPYYVYGRDEAPDGAVWLMIEPDHWIREAHTTRI